MGEPSMEAAPRKIILDCDPGHDDAVAILLAHGSPAIELLAVTTVVGNQTLEKVTKNALAVGTIAGITGVPFAAGCARARWCATIENAPDIHGESGMDGPAQPESAIELDPRHAVDLIIETIMAHEPGTITLVPTGGLTNIALAARKEPRIVERVKEVVLMGGGYHVGNWSAGGRIQHHHRPRGRTHRLQREVAGCHGRSRPDPPGAGHPRGRRADRGSGHRPGQVRPRTLDFFRGDLQGRPGLRLPAGARPVRRRLRDRPEHRDHPQGARRHRTAAAP